MSKTKEWLMKDEESKFNTHENMLEVDKDIAVTSEIRLATEQYCYINFQYYGTPSDTIAYYRYVQKLYQGGDGVDERTFNQALDRYLTEGKMDSFIYESMSIDQQSCIQMIKRAFKRINRN